MKIRNPIFEFGHIFKGVISSLHYQFHWLFSKAICQFLLPSVNTAKHVVYSELLAPHPSTKLEDHPLLAALFAAILHV